MAISDWMEDDLQECIDLMGNITNHLNCERSPCCKEKAKFHLWDDEDEARLHKRVSSAVKRVEEILAGFRKVSDKRTVTEQELTMR